MSSKESEVIIVNATTEKKSATTSDNNNVKKKASRNQHRYSCSDSMEDQLESESLLVNNKKQSQCNIPMSPVSSSSYINSPSELSDVSSSQKLLRNPSSNNISVKDSPELQSIQPAHSGLNLPIKLSASQSTTSISSKNSICSPQFCCGRNPKKITFIVFAIVLLWSIVIFCLNMQKQLSLHNEKMGILQEEILKLELRNADLKHENGKINVFLQKIATLLRTSKMNKTLYSQRGKYHKKQFLLE
ncbi:unnamed protein product [Lepeophtheirus salmonis]|uniref:(salmon louse) hypothetical protein n=2 Tax=Lepeophtheirus salmonis TaxID=72036 RepID=A0A7R8CLF1_LEPSM|nr:unnamed protein product [Lepeophtheirus salmonis]CAF2852216.1 unnamed protein product [Lepeophtheirus salmonis]